MTVPGARRRSKRPAAVGGLDPDVLLVTDTTTVGSLSAGDVWVRNRLIALGLTVTLRLASDAVPALSGYSAVVLSERAISSDHAKWAGAAIPLLVLEPFVLDSLNLATTDPITSTSTLTATVVGTHPAAGGVAAGSYSLAASGLIHPVESGTVPGSAVVFLTDGSSGVYGYALEAGAAILNGQTAQRRTVYLTGHDSLTGGTPTSTYGNIFDGSMGWLRGVTQGEATRPGTPTNLVLTPASSSSLVATWTVPSHGGSLILDYRLRLWRDSDDVLVYSSDVVPGTPFTIPDLATGVLVYGQVAARNAVGYSDGSAFSAPAAPSAPGPGDTEFFPTILAVSGAEIVNPWRGQYEWIVENDLKPNSWPWMDSYDRLGWWQLEDGEGNYDFTDIERRLDFAAARKGRHSLAVMTALSYDYGSYIWHHGGSSASFNGGVQVPQYIRNNIDGWQRGGAWFPNWNHPYYLERWEALMMALGNAYRDDPRFGYIDIRGYGDFGEWHIYGLEDTVGTLSHDNGFRLVDATVDAFRGTDGLLKKYCLMLVPVDHALRYAVGLDPKVGLRADCLGSNGGPAVGYAEPSSHPARQKWTTAPMVTEWCGIPPDAISYNDQYLNAWRDVDLFHISGFSGGNIEADSGQSQYWAYEGSIKRSGYRYELREVNVTDPVRGQAWNVNSRWGNVNVAPAYDAWAIRYELRSGGVLRATWDSTLDLRSVLPGEVTHGDTFAVSSSLPLGTYELAVKVVDPTAYLDPLRLAISGRQGDGRYILGNVTVAA